MSSGAPPSKLPCDTKQNCYRQARLEPEDQLWRVRRPLRKLSVSPGGLALAITLTFVALIVFCGLAGFSTYVDLWMRVITGIGYVGGMSAAAHWSEMRDHPGAAEEDAACREQNTHAGMPQATSVGQPKAA
jgi:hypothetical protein